MAKAGEQRDFTHEAKRSIINFQTDGKKKKHDAQIGHEVKGVSVGRGEQAGKTGNKADEEVGNNQRLFKKFEE